MTVTKYQTWTTANKSLAKRFSHRRRFEIALDLLRLDKSSRFLDYGAGDGQLISIAIERAFQASIYAFEPMEEQIQMMSAALSDADQMKVHVFRETQGICMSFDRICCLEVLEHLPERQQIDTLKDLSRLLSDDGTLIVSVPIEIGLGGLFKNFIRRTTKQRHALDTATNILRATLGLPIQRPDKDYIWSHIGFDYRDVELLFEKCGYKINRRLFSPLPIAGPAFNSQAFYVLSKQI